MGNENIKLGSGKLFIGGETFCEIKEVEDDPDEDIVHIKFPICTVDRNLRSVSITANCKFNYDLYFRVTMTNNWLRMHGYPMRRKVRLKRYGKKN